MATILDPGKSKVTIETSWPIFGSSAIALKVQLFDQMSSPYDTAQINKDLLVVKINGLFCGDVHCDDSTREENIKNVLYVNIDSLGCEKECANCIIRIEYGDSLLGKELSLDITHIDPFREENYIDKGVHFPSFSLKITGIRISKLRGDDNAVVNNINRVLNSEHRLQFKDFEVDQTHDRAQGVPDVDVDISKFHGDPEDCEKIYQLLNLYIKGLHYRKEATKFNQKREEWKAKAMRENENGNIQESSECKAIKKQYSKLMDEAHTQASRALFAFFNKDRPTREIDLHGQRVADENKLEEYRTQLLERHSEVEANEKVINARRKMNEALEYLRRADVHNRRGRDWLEIVVGAGNHSQDNIQRVKPAVVNYLQLQGEYVHFRECNKGSLLIDFRVYTGEEPCFGSFYCEDKCQSSWRSALCWKGYWQMCGKCYRRGIRSECYPMKLLEHSEQAPRKYRNYASRFTSDDHRKLCEKCLKTGIYCRKLRG